jgi:hypothetical protein
LGGVIAMPPRSKVNQLPVEVKAWLDQALAENNFSEYESLSAELSGRGFAISKSALNRYGQDFEMRLSSLKMASEQAKAVVLAAPDEEGAVNEALMRLVQEHLFNLLMTQEGKIDLPKVAKAIAELGRASVTQKKFSAEQKKAAQEEARREMLEEQKAKLAAMPVKGGVTEDTKMAIREALGIV